MDWPYFKRNNLRHEADIYFQKGTALPDAWRERILKEQSKVDRNTILDSK